MIKVGESRRPTLKRRCTCNERHLIAPDCHNDLCYYALPVEGASQLARRITESNLPFRTPNYDIRTYLLNNIVITENPTSVSYDKNGRPQWLPYVLKLQCNGTHRDRTERHSCISHRFPRLLSFYLKISAADICGRNILSDPQCDNAIALSIGTKDSERQEVSDQLHGRNARWNCTENCILVL